MTGKVSGTLGFLAMTAWAMAAVSPAGAIVFWDPLVALTSTGLAGGLVVVGRLLNTEYSSG